MSTPPLVKHCGRAKGKRITVPRSDWAGMALLSDFGWMNKQIGDLWGVGAVQTGRLVRNWKEDRR